MPNSEKIPLHLLWFFLRIRSHHREKDYFVSRFADMPMDDMLIETQMIDKLQKHNLVMLPEKRLEKVYDPLTKSLDSGITYTTAGTEYHVSYPATFDITPGGKYLLRELFIGALGTVGWTVFVAVVSAATALFVAA